jgi:DNA-binding MarR family transcriptional regulator
MIPAVASTRWLTAPQERAWRRYRRMRTLLDLQLARDLNQDSGLSESDYDVLSTLSERREGRWRARDLAAQLLWSTSRLAHHVGRMEQRGLVTRMPCADDARGALISLTGRGRATLRDAAPRHVDSVRRHMIDLLTDEEVAALDAIAGKVITRLAGEVPDVPVDLTGPG